MKGVVTVFFFSSRRRHTRYIGDWSSDVCSSDLYRLARQALISEFRKKRLAQHEVCDAHPELVRAARECGERSEERRVGKECRSRRSAGQTKKCDAILLL